MNQQISLKQALLYGYLTTRKNLWFFIKLFFVSFLLLFILLFIFFVVAIFIPPETGFLRKISIQLPSFLFFILSFCMITGFIKMSLQLTENSDTSSIKIVSTIFTLPSGIFSFGVATMLYELFLFVGLFLFIFPGLLFAARMYFYGFFIVDKRIGPGLALKLSAKITSKHIGKMVQYLLLVLALNAVGIMTLVGIYITLPITFISSAYLYKKLLSITDLKDVSLPVSQPILPLIPETFSVIKS